MTRTLQSMVAAGGLLLAACGPSTGGDPPQTFIALQKDFDGYRSWSRYDLGTSEGDSVHLSGHRIVYLNKKPDPGSTAFPVGTVIVKTLDEDAATPGKIFAMTKRGGGFNSTGAIGWEWFELEKASDGSPVIVWRGIAPPAGEGYSGSISGGSCNTCHVGAASNDYVTAGPLKLSTF